MATLLLEDRARTGIPKIDHAHELLLTGLESLVDAVRKNVADKHVLEYLDLLEFHVTEHFQDEEGAMRRSGYPLVLTHLIQHQRMVSTFHELIEEYRAKGCNKAFIIRMGNFMSTQMVDHVYRYDLHLAQWLQNPAHLAAANQLHLEA
jgi:hemerythrin-like metal-binding protein